MFFPRSGDAGCHGVRLGACSAWGVPAVGRGVSHLLCAAPVVVPDDVCVPDGTAVQGAFALRKAAMLLSRWWPSHAALLLAVPTLPSHQLANP